METNATTEEKMTNKIQASFLTGQNPDLIWRCQNCNRVIDKLKTAEQVENYLANFKREKYRPCPKCRTRNWFTVGLTGDVGFHSLDNNNKEIKI